MRDEIYQKMLQAGCEYLFLAGTYHNNPNLHYMAPTTILFHFFIIVQRDKKPLIFYHDMDRSEAEKTGFDTVNYQELYKHGYNPGQADPVDRTIGLYKAACHMLGIKGNVLLHEYQEVNQAARFMERIKDEIKEIKVIETDMTAFFDQIRERKDEREIQAIAQAGKKSGQVFTSTERYLAHCYDKNGCVVDENGVPVTISQVKAMIQAESARLNLLTDMGFIFSQGRDAGIPHHGGDPTDILRPGETLVFDFGPLDQDSDYLFDMTRSYCLKSAAEHVVQAYNTLREIQQLVEEQIKVDTPFSFYQNLVCDYFEKAGYPTLRSHPFTTRGFTHGLGHGIGIEVHERPNFYLKGTQTIQPGHVFTVEPGLYFPDEGWGLRLEDVIAIHDDGRPENLTPHPKNLVIPIDTWAG